MNINMNRITSRYIVFAAALFLLVVYGEKNGWQIILLSALVPIGWLWTFSLRHTSTGMLITASDAENAQNQPSVGWMPIALCASVAWLVAPVFVMLGELLNNFFVAVVNGSPLGYYTLRAGVIEELLKFSAMLAVTGYLSPGAIRHPADGIVLACAAALGFAAYENIFQNLHLLELQGWERAKAFMLGTFIRVPLHALYGALWGASFGIFGFLTVPKRYFVMASGLFTAMFVHGFWDALVNANGWYVVPLVAVLYAALWYGYIKLWNAVKAMRISGIGTAS